MSQPQGAGGRLIRIARPDPDRRPVADQVALHGLLANVRDLGLPLPSVSRIGPEQEPEKEP